MASLSVNQVVRVSCLSRSWFVLYGVNKPTARQTSHANDFVNAKSHVREKPLRAGHFSPYLIFLKCWKTNSTTWKYCQRGFILMVTTSDFFHTLISEKSDSQGPKLSASSFMGFFGGTSPADTLNYDETCKLLCFCAQITSGISRSARTYLCTSCIFFPVVLAPWQRSHLWRCFTVHFCGFFPSASHFHVFFPLNSTFRFAILSCFNPAETFHLAFRYVCLRWSSHSKHFP